MKKFFTYRLNDYRKRFYDQNQGEKGRKKAVSVNIAITPSVIPKDIEPVSPIKNLAG